MVALGWFRCDDSEKKGEPADAFWTTPFKQTSSFSLYAEDFLTTTDICIDTPPLKHTYAAPPPLSLVFLLFNSDHGWILFFFRLDFLWERKNGTKKHERERVNVWRGHDPFPRRTGSFISSIFLNNSIDVDQRENANWDPIFTLATSWD